MKGYVIFRQSLPIPEQGHAYRLLSCRVTVAGVNWKDTGKTAATYEDAVALCDQLEGDTSNG